MKKALTASLGVAIGVLVLWLPASALAVDQFCYGSIGAKPTTTEQETPVEYTFACRETAKQMLLQFSSEISIFEATADVLDPAGGGLRPDDRWAECTGELPGYAFGCSGTYTGGQGRIAKGTVETTADPCARDPETHRLLLRASVVVNDATGLLSSHDLGTVTGCPAFVPPPSRASCRRLRRGSKTRSRCFAQIRRANRT